MGLTYEQLAQTVDHAAAIRRVQRLQPAGGPGDKLYPPTYPGEGRNAPAQHIFESRRIAGQDVPCVLLDSVQSQANRLEEALLRAIDDGRIAIPRLAVDFAAAVAGAAPRVADLGTISSLDAPHRVFDAIIRDSQLDGRRFTETPEYAELLLAKPANALQVFRLSPTSLLFGVWNSTGQGGGLGAKFTRCIVSEIVGVGVDHGRSGAVRIDPLGIRSGVRVVGGPLDYRVSTDPKEKGAVRPSEVNHSNVISTPVERGVTVDYAVHTAVITCAGLRRLSFPGARAHGPGRTVLAAMGLLALTEQDRIGYALRSRCDLVPESQAAFEVVHSDGSSDAFELLSEDAVGIFNTSVDAALSAGFPWEREPLRLVPQDRLVDLVLASRDLALAGQTEEDGGV